MKRIMEISKIYQEERLLIENYVIKNLILLRILDIMGINANLLQWFIIFFDKKTFKTNKGAGINSEIILSKFNKGFRFLSCVIDIYSKYACFL